MASSSRTPLPAHISTTGLGNKTAASPGSTYSSTPRSAAASNWESPAFISPENRKDSTGSMSSDASSPSAASDTKSYSGTSKKASSPTVNVYTHCGRHSDQYLFGGWSKMFHRRN